MRKTYKKPEVYIESFKFTQSIAAGCSAFTVGHATIGSDQGCAWIIDGMAHFNDGMSACEVGPLEGFCYNAPAEGFGVLYS